MTTIEREVQSEFVEIIAEVFANNHGITRDARLIEDLGMDSFAATELLILIEHRYQIRIAESDLTSGKTVGNWIDLLINKYGIKNSRKE